MILAAIVAGITVYMASLATGVILYVITKRRISAAIREVITAPSPDQPSPLAGFVRLVADVFAQEIAASIKATFMGVQSVEAKNTRRAAAAAAMSKSPILRFLLSSFPAIGKKLAANPELAEMAGAALSKVMTPAAGPVPAPANGSKPVSFSL